MRECGLMYLQMIKAVKIMNHTAEESRTTIMRSACYSHSYLNNPNILKTTVVAYSLFG